ncbi:MAG: DUF4131 domain-containing protein [Dorea sp.]|nr:DUF4131 domain-containing protein [Dorea sp.]
MEENEVRYKRRKDQKQSVQKESVQKEPIQKESVQEEAVQKESVQEEAVQKELVQKESVQEEAVQKESVQKKLIQKQSDQERTLQESRVIVYTDSDIQFQIGNKIELAGEVSFFQGARNPGNFDQKRFYQIQDIHGRVWAEEIHVADACIWKWRAYFADLRRRWKDALTVHMGEEDGAVMSAMILGEKSGMDQEVKALYQVNGIGHILAKKCTRRSICV